MCDTAHRHLFTRVGHRTAFLAALLTLLLPIIDAAALEFDRNARKMGLNGIAWAGCLVCFKGGGKTRRGGIQQALSSNLILKR